MRIAGRDSDQGYKALVIPTIYGMEDEPTLRTGHFQRKPPPHGPVLSQARAQQQLYKSQPKLPSNLELIGDTFDSN